MAMEVAGAVRNAYNAEGRMFVVAGQTLYQITPGGVSVPLGTIPGVGRVSFSHNQITNGNEILINNGNAGYIYNTVTQVFQRITDTSYPGGLRAVFINNRFVQIEPARRYVFNSDLADGLNYNALDRFTSETSPDLVMGIESIGNQLAVFSSTTTEWFEDTGANPQPFRSTGIVADKGAAGPFCTAKLDNQLFFLADDGVFYRYQGYNPVRISTKPIEQSIRNKNWFNAFTTVWEDSGYAVCYWTFPDGLTWGYDASTGKWHRRESYGFNRWRLNSLTYWQNKWYGGDFQAGKLYELDWDYILEGDQEFISYRSAGAISDNQNRVIHERLELIVNTGMRETEAVEFTDQPEGPTITGSAPDPLLSEPYTFTYTVTPGDAPIVRTILVEGSTNLSEFGLSWNQSTATVSGTPTKTGTITLIPRVIDANQLFDQLTDTLLISEVEVLLVTSTNNLGDGIWSKSYSQEDPVFSGIPTSTGADIVGGVGAAYGNTFSVLTPSAGRYADSPLTEWLPSTRPTSGPLDGAVHQHAGGPLGWLATTINAGLYKAGMVPDEYVAVPGSDINEDWGGVRMVRYTGGKYYLSIGGDLATSTDLETYTLVYNRVGNDSIVEFNDICDVDGVLYACVGWNASFVTRRYQLRRSNDDGATWPDLLIDQTDSPRPLQVQSNGDVVVCLGGGGLLGNAKIWTSLDDFATPLDCGIMGINDSTISESYQYSNGLQIATGSGLFFILGQQTDSELAVTYNPETEAFSEPYSNQTLDAIGIVAGDPL